MRKALSLLFLSLMAVLLAACGPFQVQVEPTAPVQSPTTAPTTAATAPAEPTQPASTPAQPTQGAPSPQPSDTPAPTAAPTQAPTPAAELNVSVIHMNTPTQGWAIGRASNSSSDGVFTTADGGKTWTVVTPPATPGTGGNPSFPQINGVFSDPQHAWVAFTSPQGVSSPASDVVWHTSDGGATWQSGPIDKKDLTGDYFLPELGFSDLTHGWLLAHLGVGMSHDYVAIYTTADAGATWQQVVGPQSQTFTQACEKKRIAFSDAQNGWAAVNCHGVVPGLTFLHTTNGGQTWDKVDLPAPSDQPDLFTNTEVACGVDDVVVTSPQTRSALVACQSLPQGQPKAYLYSGSDEAGWTSYPIPVAYGGLDFTSPTSVWFLGNNDPNNQGSNEVFHSTDGGQHWKSSAAVDWSGKPDFVDDLNGWVVAHLGDQSALVRTIDGGILWDQVRPVLPH